MNHKPTHSPGIGWWTSNWLSRPELGLRVSRCHCNMSPPMSTPKCIFSESFKYLILTGTYAKNWGCF